MARETSAGAIWQEDGAAAGAVAAMRVVVERSEGEVAVILRGTSARGGSITLERHAAGTEGGGYMGGGYFGGYFGGGYFGENDEERVVRVTANTMAGSGRVVRIGARTRVY